MRCTVSNQGDRALQGYQRAGRKAGLANVVVLKEPNDQEKLIALFEGIAAADLQGIGIGYLLSRHALATIRDDARVA